MDVESTIKQLQAFIRLLKSGEAKLIFANSETRFVVDEPMETVTEGELLEAMGTDFKPGADSWRSLRINIYVPPQKGEK